MIAANPHVADMAAYALADLTAPPGKRLISLCQNESLRPPSPLASGGIGPGRPGSAALPRSRLDPPARMPFRTGAWH